MTIRVIVADDQELVRTGFRMILSGDPEIEIVAEAADGRAAVAAALAHVPRVVLMDIRMPVLDGLAATREIRAAQPGVEVVILTTFDDDEYLYAALDAGASGFLLKDAPAPELARAVHVVAAGEALLAPTVTRRVIDRTLRGAASPDAIASVARLSDREREVLGLIAAGRSNAEIAADLFVSSATVKTHVAHILQKLPARDRVQAVILAHRAGLDPGA